MILALALAAATCPIDRAIYRLRGDSRFRMGFAHTPRPSDAASDLRVFLRTPRRVYWFGFIVLNGLSGTSLQPASSPHAPDDAPAPADADHDDLVGHGLAFDTFTADLSAPGQAPRSDTPAPAHLFSRDLRTALWYDATELAGGDAGARGEIMPVGMFDRAGCARHSH